MSDAHPVPAAADYASPVREYLAYCEDARGQLEARGARLDPRYHPSADGAAKMIPHGSDRASADAIRRTFGEMAPAGAGRVPEPEGRPEREVELEAEIT